MIVRNSTHEPTINLTDAFSVPFFTMVVQEDTSELYDNKDFVDNSNQVQSNTIKNYRVLENFPNTKNILLKYIRLSLKQLGYACDFDLTTSWCTKLYKGDVEVSSHKHKNCWFSAVYYYGKYDDLSANFYMDNPLNDFTSFEDKIISTNKYNTPIVFVPPTEKSLIIFPSYVSHGICKQHSDLIRYSLAMNIVPIGKYGNGSDGLYDTSWY
tara:strand:+ start:72 stop:704 length:633 start_codon:yes stop_codon:yes gene_type:complete